MNAHTLTLDAMLFDMDGTLVESIDAVERCWRAWAKDYDVDPQQILAVCHGRQSRTTIKMVAPHLDVEAAAANILERELSEPGGVKAIAGAAQMLEQLEGLPFTVVTSAPRRLAEHRLKLAGLAEPAHMVAAEDVEEGKPHPGCFLLGGERLRAAPRRTLVLEDSLAGLKAGRAAGMQTLQICATHPPVDKESPLRIRDYRGATIERIGDGTGRPAFNLTVQRIA
jgi:sugar-phosphatase